MKRLPINHSKKIIVNADGFGFGQGATQGIFDAIKDGQFITSVSVNANFQEAERIQELANEYPEISIGIHLNPMVGKPCLPPQQVSSLVRRDGYFYENKFYHLLKRGLISMVDLEAEFDAQISKIGNLVGNRLTHLDSQENSHLNYFELFLKLAQKWNIKRIRTNSSLICLEAANPVRSRTITYLCKPHIWFVHQYRKCQMQKARKLGIRMANALITVGYAGNGNKTNPLNWERIIHNIPNGTYEIYCHPAYPDEVMRRWTLYCEERLLELKILRQNWLVNMTREMGVSLISFNDF